MHVKLMYMPIVPNVATAKFGTFVLESASVADMAISAIIFANMIEFATSRDIKPHDSPICERKIQHILNLNFFPYKEFLVKGIACQAYHYLPFILCVVKTYIKIC